MFLKGMIKRMLVVAPLSIVSVWEQEFEKFADYEYSLTILDGGAAKKSQMLKYARSDGLEVIVVNYESACLLLVHHLRKQIDESDVFNMINGSMGLMGASDTTWILARKKRTDENTAFVATGRDISDINLVLYLDKSVFHWEVIGTAEDQSRLEAKRAYESNPVIKTIKAIVEAHPQGWRGNCTEIKVMIYEKTGELYTKSVESIGKTINGYADRLLADGITHRAERGKRHYFEKKRATLFNYSAEHDDD